MAPAALTDDRPVASSGIEQAPSPQAPAATGGGRSPARQVATLAVSRGVSALSQAGMLVLLARATSPATFGLVSVVIAASAALALADLGLQPLATRLYAIRDDHPRALRAMFMQRSLLCAVALLATAACLGAAAATDLPWWVALGPVAACGERVVLGDLNLHVAVGNNREQMYALVGMRLVALAVFAALLTTSLDAAFAFWIASAVASTAAALYTRGTLPAFVRPTRPEVFSLLSEARHFWKANVAAIVRNQDPLVVTMAAGKAAAGVYTLPVRLTAPFTLVMDAIATAALPIARRRQKDSMRTLYVMAAAAFGLAATAGLMVILLAPQVIHLLAGPKYAGAVPVFRIVIVASIIGLPETFLTRTLQATGHEKAIGDIYVAVACFTIGSVTVGAATGGATGAAWALLTTMLFELFLLLSLLRLRRPA